MDNEISKAGNLATKAPEDVSPLAATLNQNDEYLMAIEKQLSVLETRLGPISDTTPREGSPMDAPGLKVRGNSTIVDAFSSHGHRLASISDQISRITRNLEI